MNVRIHWYDRKKRIILQTYQGQWNADDVRYAVATTSDLAEAVGYDIFVITVFDATSQTPGHLLDLANYMRNKSIPNVRAAFLVRPDVYLTSALSLARFLIPNYVSDLRVVYSIEDALAQIHAHSTCQ